MPSDREVVVPPDWHDFYESTGIPAAVRIGDTLRLTGHTGTRADGSFPANVTEQIRQTFQNIADTLTYAGYEWADVVEITSYHVGLQAQAEALMTVAAEFIDRPFPAWSAVGVIDFFEAEAVVEITCVASNDRAE